MISTVLLGNGFSNSIFAFSNTYSNPQMYDSGVRDGNRDCQSGADIPRYQQSAEYRGHSKYYKQGYDDTVNKCNSFGGGDGLGGSGGNIIPVQNSEQRHNIITQGQSNNQKVL